jgi:hypothetical protein
MPDFTPRLQPIRLLLPRAGRRKTNERHQIMGQTPKQDRLEERREDQHDRKEDHRDDKHDRREDRRDDNN